MNEILLEDEKEAAKQYRFSLWWVEHRSGFKKFGIRLFIFADALILLFVFWNLIDAFAIRYDGEMRAVSEVVVVNQQDLHDYTTSQSADLLSVADAQVFSTGDGQYDFFTEIENKNEDWWAEFQYQFSYDGGQTEQMNGFILPSQNKPVADLAIHLDVPPRSTQFELTSMRWHRVDHHLIPDYKGWSEDRLNIEVKSPMFSQDAQIDETVVSRTTFTVFNHTAYSYSHPKFFVLLRRGSATIGINQVALQSLDSGSAQDVVLNWFGNVPASTQVDVIPEINLFDKTVYKALVGETSIDTRSGVIR